MGFDVENFGIGLAAGWASAYAVYRFRRQIGSAVSASRQQATSAQNYATRSADGRYINDLINIAETSHLAGRFTKLTDILVEPRFVPAPELPQPPDDDVIHSVFHVVPQTPDHPYLHAVYNIETLAIDDLATGDRALALLGSPGSGRTTALLTIALKSLSRVQFQPIHDSVQQHLDEEEAALTDKQRAQREKERRTIEQRAREQLTAQHGIDFDREDATGFNRYIPVYVHLANVNISAEEFGPQIDPAEPLIRAVQSQVGTITARTLPLRLYRRLAQGQALLLIDGLDDLQEDEQQEKLLWLKAFADRYRENFIIVTGTPYGYGPLAHLGLTPVFLRPWSDLNMQQVARRWASAWPVIGGTRRRPADRPEEKQVGVASTNNRALSPVDLSLKIWTAYADDAEVGSYEGWLRAFVQRHLPKKQALDEVLPQLAQIAALQLDQGFITLEALEGMAGLENLAEAEDDETAGDSELAPDSAKDTDDKEKKEDTSAQAKFLNTLRRVGLIVNYRGNRYQFRHPFIAAFLASYLLKNAQPDILAEKAQTSTWTQALAYAATHTSIEPAVKARLSAPPNILQNQVLEVSRWLAYSDPQVSWRGPLLKHIGNMMILPNQYPLIRERAAAALIGARDRNTLFIFRQAARNANADVRRLACLGIGATGNREAINDLIPLLDDQHNDVQLAAALALGAIGNDEALEALVISLTEGSEQLRQAVAEAMAALPDEGYPILYDAISHEDMMVRRAATFGLRRLGSRWTTDALYRAFLEDEQWYVRSSAQQAFEEIQQHDGRGPQGYPAAEAIPWLGAWVAERGENIPSGDAAYQVLFQALNDGDPLVRMMAARVIGQLGVFTAAKTLYAALRDRQEEVRAAAHRSLADLEMQLGQSFPAPI